MPLHGGTVITETPLPVRAVGRAARLAGAVHDGSPDEVAVIVRTLNRQELIELAVTLAAMVPVEYSPGDLLAWNDRRYGPVDTQFQTPLAPVLLTSRRGTVRTLQPHGTHAAFNRHKKREEPPCVACAQGERDFQRERMRRRRMESA